MSEPTAGDENPVFVAEHGGASTAPRIRRSIPPFELRAIVRRRRMLLAATIAFVGSSLVALFALLRFAVVTVPHQHLPIYRGSDETYGLLAMAGNMGGWIGFVALLIVGRRLLETTDATHVGLKTLGLLIPGLNVFVAALIDRQARQSLELRGVRVGWLWCDYSAPDAHWNEFARRSVAQNSASLPLEDDPNWIFRGATPEAIGVARPRGWMTLRELKTLAAGRRAIVFFLGVLVAGAILVRIAVACDPSSRIVLLRDLTVFEGLSSLACAPLAVASIGTLLTGIRVMEALRSSRFELKICGLVFPGSNVVVSMMILREAKQTLEAHGVRVGWLTCDYSQAIVDDSSPDAASAA